MAAAAGKGLHGHLMEPDIMGATTHYTMLIQEVLSMFCIVGPFDHLSSLTDPEVVVNGICSPILASHDSR